MVSDEPPAKTTYELREVEGGTELTLISETDAGTKTAKMSGSGQYIVDNLNPNHCFKTQFGEPCGVRTSDLLIKS